MRPDSLIELIGHARVHPDETYTRATDVRATLEFRSRCSRRASARYRATIMSLFGVSCLAIFMRDHIACKRQTKVSLLSIGR